MTNSKRNLVAEKHALTLSESGSEVAKYTFESEKY